MASDMGGTTLIKQYFYSIQNFKFSFCNFFNVFIFSRKNAFSYNPRHRNCTKNLEYVDFIARYNTISCKT